MDNQTSPQPDDQTNQPLDTGEETSQTAPEVSQESADATPEEALSSSQPVTDEAAAESPAPVVTAAPQSTVNSAPAGTKRSKRPLLLILALIVLLVAGYLVYNATKTKSPVSTATTATKKDVALLRVGTNFPNPTSFYPTTTDDGVEIDENHQVFQGLTTYKDGTKVVPLLAKSWTNPDANTWVFALQHNVKFHDGNVMTAKQVVASIEQVMPSDYGQEFASTIKSVSAVDDYTVKITTASPDSLLPNELTFLNVFDTDDTAHPNSAVNGTGPYTVKAGTTPSAGTIDLTAVPSYWGGHVYTRELVFKSYDSYDDLVKALNNHQLDVGGSLLAKQQAVLNSSVETFNIPSTRVGQLQPNTQRGGPLANVKVRQALWLALDPAAIAKAYGIQATPVSQIVPPQIPGYDAKLTRPATDAAKAKQELADAGYPNGFSFTLTYYSPATDALVAEVQKELKAAGVTVVLDPQTDGQALEEKAIGGKTDMFYNTESSDLIDGSDIMFTYVQQAYYDNPQLDSLYTQSTKTFDSAKRLQLLQQMSDTLYNDKGTLPIYSENITWGEAKNLNLHFAYFEISGEPGINYSQVYSQ